MQITALLTIGMLGTVNVLCMPLVHRTIHIAGLIATIADVPIKFVTSARFDQI